MKITDLLSIFFMLVIFSCEENGSTLPYTSFQNSEYQDISTDLISIDKNSNYSLVINVGYNSPAPSYLLQINENPLIDLRNSQQLKKEKHGWNGKEGLNFEIMRLSILLAQEEVEVGDTVKIIVRHSETESIQRFQIL